MPAAGPPVAGGKAAGQAPPGRRGQSSARPGRACAPPASQGRVPDCSGTRGYVGAWSRSRSFFPPPLCDRPGCYDHPVTSLRNPARYCGPACRQAVRKVRDRERKWLWRGTLDGRKKRAYEYQTARRCHSPRRPNTAAPMTTAGTSTVTIPPVRAGRQLSCCFWVAGYVGKPVHSQEPTHDPKTDSGSRATTAASHNRMVLGGPRLRP